MIVTIGSTKGGAGKSTIAVQLALARSRAGRGVLLVDGDQQATSQTAITLRAESGRLPAPSCVWFPDHVWALSDMAAVIDEVRATRDGLVAYAVLNFGDPGISPANREAAAAIAEFPQFTLIDTPVRQRKALAIALGHGLSVEELTPRDGKACEEIATLTGIVFADADTSRRILNANANHQADAQAGRAGGGEGAQGGDAGEPGADHGHLAAGDVEPG
jgi:chromosome partitioning protein